MKYKFKNLFVGRHTSGTIIKIECKIVLANFMFSDTFLLGALNQSNYTVLNEFMSYILREEELSSKRYSRLWYAKELLLN